jgi:hypothetical protein
MSPSNSAYVLRAEWTGPCQKASPIDVNLGNSAQSFVEAAYCQVNGTMPSSATISQWVSALMQPDQGGPGFGWHARRSDVVRTFCNDAGVGCPLSYSIPWVNKPLPSQTVCIKKNKADLGAVTMFFFFGCPGGTNCGMDWANTHAYGMNVTDSTYYNGYYNPFTNSGFWTGELNDAKAAGLQFIIPNMYGNDQAGVSNLETALSQQTNPVKIGLFNDTWAYGNILPGVSFNNPTQAAQTIYTTEWKPFFSTIKPQYWYTINGHPLIYFYNAGTLTPLSSSAPVVSAMKQLFLADFGVTPFVVVDIAYFADPNMHGVADGEFQWDTTINDPVTNIGSFTLNGLTLDNGFVKWDSFNRDNGAVAANAGNDHKMIKGPEVLQNILRNGSNADLLLLQTWNDLGEGTGFNREYDYYYQGQWLSPDYFMNITRQANCIN